MNILIIGTSGYIGSRVAASLAGAGHQVTALRRPGGGATAYPSVAGDLTDPAALTVAARGYDRVIQVGAPIDDKTDLAAADALKRPALKRPALKRPALGGWPAAQPAAAPEHRHQHDDRD
jgi:uncharacterized protein YbjT (DUF2867 family)